MPNNGFDRKALLVMLASWHNIRKGQNNHHWFSIQNSCHSSHIFAAKKTQQNPTTNVDSQMFLTQRIWSQDFAYMCHISCVPRHLGNLLLSSELYNQTMTETSPRGFPNDNIILCITLKGGPAENSWKFQGFVLFFENGQLGKCRCNVQFLRE